MIFFSVLPESIHWLATKRSLEEAEKVLQRAAKINRIHIPRNCLTEELEKVEDEVEDNKDLANNLESDSESINILEEQQKQYSIKDIFRVPGLRVYGLVITLFW